MFWTSARLLAALALLSALIAAPAVGQQAPDAIATSVVPTFEQGVGVSLTERPAFIDADRNVRPGSISGRDAWGSLTWTEWGGAVATGTGNYAWHTPDGSDIQTFPVSVQLDQGVWCGETRVYTRITGTFTGAPPPEMGPTLVNGVLPYECASDANGSEAFETCADTVLLKGDLFHAANIRRSGLISCRLTRNILRAAYGAKKPLKIIKRKPSKGGGRPTLWITGGWRCVAGGGSAACWSAKKERYNTVEVESASRSFAIAADVT